MVAREGRDRMRAIWEALDGVVSYLTIVTICRSNEYEMNIPVLSSRRIRRLSIKQPRPSLDVAHNPAVSIHPGTILLRLHRPSPLRLMVVIVLVKHFELRAGSAAFRRLRMLLVGRDNLGRAQRRIHAYGHHSEGLGMTTLPVSVTALSTGKKAVEPSRAEDSL